MQSEKKRILVVDDEPGITRLLKLNLEHTGRYMVRCVNAAADAFTVAGEFDPDLILLDVMMPELDGGDLAIRFQNSGKFKDVPIVFLTAAVKKEEVSAHAGHIAGLPFIAKPVNIDEVTSCIEAHLR